MNRYTLVGGLIVLAGSRFILAPRHPFEPVVLVVPAATYQLGSAGSATVPVRFGNRALDYVYIRGCGAAPHLLIERRIAGHWYVHERLSRVCEGPPRRTFAFLDWGRQYGYPITVHLEGRYRVRAYYSVGGGQHRRVPEYLRKYVSVQERQGGSPPMLPIVSREFDVLPSPSAPDSATSGLVADAGERVR